MAKFNSSVVNGDLNISSIISENGMAIDSKYGVSIDYVRPTISNIDNNIYIEPDGSKWAHVFHHNNPSGTQTYFSNSDNFTNTVNKDGNRWFDIGKVSNQISTMWEIILVQKSTSSSDIAVYRFKQFSDPMTATFNDTYYNKIEKFTSSTTTYFKGSTATAIDDMSSSFGGIYYLDNRTYLVQNNAISGNWWGATGCWTAYDNNGIPGYNGALCTTGYMDMYIRIDSLYSTIIMKNANGQQIGSPMTLR